MESGTAAVIFVVLAVALSAAEIIAPGLVLLPFGIGAGIAAVAGFLGAPPLLQAIIFLVASAAVYAGLRPLSARLNRDEPDAEGIGANRLIGATGTVLERIEGGDVGLVRIDREEWRAEAASGHALVPGMGIRVVEVRGTRVLVTAEHPDTLGRAPHADPGGTAP